MNLSIKVNMPENPEELTRIVSETVGEILKKKLNPEEMNELIKLLQNDEFYIVL